MDLSKVFDTLDHNILLNRLHYYGITGIALALFYSYYNGRKRFVEIDGSILGRLHFLIHMNDIPNSSDNLTLFYMRIILHFTPASKYSQTPWIIMKIITPKKVQISLRSSFLSVRSIETQGSIWN